MTGKNIDVNELLFKAEIRKFINYGLKSKIPTNRWMYHCEEQEVYLRLGPKIIEGKRYDFIQIANIRTEEKNQKKGAFTGFLHWLEQFNTSIYIENVHNPVLPPFLLKNGFIQNLTMWHEYDYYKLITN